MGKFLRIAVMFVSVLCSLSAWAQTGTTISGTVSDDQGVSLPGVTITAKGTNISAASDMNGKYSIKVPATTTTLVFSYIGMQAQEVSIDGRTSVNVTLKTASTQLDDVVVIGYGSTLRSNITSAISSITEKDIKDLPVAGVDQALQGKVAGVTVNSNGGAPGGGVSVRIRGITSVGAGGNEPLYVIDGVPIAANRNSVPQDQLGGNAGQSVNSALASLNPSDIASIDILKDASAQAIYGSRAANGVVLITTKKGKAGEGKIQYDMYYGRAEVPKKLDLMDLSQFAQYTNEVFLERGAADGVVYEPIGEYQNPSVLGKGTDWQDAIFQTGITQNHQLAFSGGSDKTTYYTSLNYYNQSGTIIGSGLERYNVHFNLDQKVKPWLNFGINANMSRSNQRITLTNGSDAIVTVAAYNSPAAPVTTGDGNYAGVVSVGGYSFGNLTNPVAKAKLRDIRNIQSQAFANIYADIIFSKHFNLRNEASFSSNQAMNSSFQPYVAATDGQVILTPSKLIEQRGTGIFWRLVNYLNYNQTFGVHNVTAQLGHEAQLSNYDDVTASRQNLALNYPVLRAGEVANQTVDGAKYPSALDSYFVRLGYTYKDRYSLNVSARKDGSSTFGPDKKYGYFPAASIGWTITNESFAKDIKNVDYIKLRLGAGAVGNQNAGANNAYATNISLISTSPFGGIAGFPYNVGNPNLQWESVKTYNAGLDVAFFNHRLEGSVDVYKKVTTEMILPAQLPAYTGLSQNTYDPIQPPIVNSGKMTNTGIDITLNSTNVRSADFSWQTTLIFSHYKNILNELNASNAAYYGYQEYGNAVTITKTAAGGPVGQFYGFVTDGLFRSQAELDAATINGQIQGIATGPKGTYLGDIRYKDFNNDGKLDQSDMRYLGNPNPKFTYGLTNRFSYKGIDMSVFLQGSYEAKILNYTKRSIESLRNVYYNQLSEVLTDRYSATNPNGTLPRYNEWHQNNLLMSDRFLESGSYLRIQNVTIGYNLPERLAKKAMLSAARIYVSGQNIYTFTKYTGYDPELGSYNNSFTQTNVDTGNYPNPRTFTIGANLTF